MGQLGFFDADKRLAAISAKGDPLEMIDRLVPFDSFRAEIEAVVLTPALVRIEKSDLPHRATSANLVVISQTRTNWLKQLFFEVPFICPALRKIVKYCCALSPLSFQRAA